jgi:hypothetical protein
VHRLRVQQHRTRRLRTQRQLHTQLPVAGLTVAAVVDMKAADAINL